MESTRRLVIASVLGAIVIAGAGASDFVFGSFWSSHAMLTSLLASLIVLAVTVAVVGEVVERRARLRWRVLGQYVLFELVQTARATWIGLVELAGLGMVASDSPEGLRAGAGAALEGDRLATGIAGVLADPQQRAATRDLVVAVGAQSRSLIASWAPLMVDAGPYVPLFNRHVELNSLLAWIAHTLEPGALTEWLAADHEVLVRSSVATEYVAPLDDDWLATQLVAAAQLAVGLDFESAAVGFKLVPIESWQARIARINIDVNDLGRGSAVALPDEL